jgi:hypothetical protein
MIGGFSMDFSRTTISLRRPPWSYSKVQAFYRFMTGVPTLPTLRYGIAKSLSKKGGEFFCDYVSSYNFGLYSNISTTLEDVLTLYRAKINVNRIDYSAGMNWFKDKKDKDVYQEFFSKAKSGPLKIPKQLRFNSWDVHKVYKQLPLGDLCKAASILFSPSLSVVNIANAMTTSSGVSPERSIAIIYRGTDKSSEVRLAAVEDYIRVANEILRKRAADFEIIVQTDQEQVRNQILTSFDGRCRFFKELPVTRGSTAIHQLEFGTEIMMSREDFAKRMLAATIILSKCAYVITHTGNVGAWVAIYRGTSNNLYQFDANATLQTP